LQLGVHPFTATISAFTDEEQKRPFLSDVDQSASLDADARQVTVKRSTGALDWLGL